MEECGAVGVAEFVEVGEPGAKHLAGMARNKELLDNNEWAPTVRAIEDLFNAITGPPPRRYR